LVPYRRLAFAVLLSAVRDADLWPVARLVGTIRHVTPEREIIQARQFLTEVDECGGWCAVAGLDGDVFAERMRGHLQRMATERRP
tara:strand:- start:580 stop:834 length:255 start_codon:yes stop_codon:yes gene_type:complete